MKNRMFSKHEGMENLEDEISHYNSIEAIESTLHSTIRKLMIEYDHYLVYETLEGFVQRLGESKKRVSD